MTASGPPPHPQTPEDGPAPDGRYAPPAGDTVRRPPEVEISFWLWIAVVALGVIGAIVTLTSLDTIADQVSGSLSRGQVDMVLTITKVSAVAGALIGGVVYILFAIFLRRGKNWARIVLTVIGAIAVVAGLFTVFGGSSTTIQGQSVQLGGPVNTTLSAIQLLLIIAAVALLFRPRANAFFASRR